MARKKKFWTIWRWIIAMSFCLNIFGGYTFLAKKWSKMPLFKREVVKLVIDGAKYRWWKIGE